MHAEPASTSHSLLSSSTVCALRLPGVALLPGRVLCRLVLEQNTCVRPAKTPHWLQVTVTNKVP